MKKLLSLVKRPSMVLLLTLLALELVIFFTWPRLSHTPALRVHVMLVIAGVVLVLIGVDALRRHLEARRTAKEAQSLGGSDPQAIRRALDGAFTALLREVPRRGAFYKEDSALGMPWLLVLGPPGCGKSAALRKGALATEIVAQDAPQSPCRFWLNDQAVFLEVSWPLACAAEASNVNDKSAKNAELDWQAILHWLYGRRKTLDAVVLQVAIDELVAAPPAQAEYLAGQMRRALSGIAAQFGSVPVRLLLSRCDRIDGFRPFFSDLAADERAEAWGFSLDIASARATPGAAAASGLQGLADAALQRASSRAMQLAQAEREAVLGFPSELLRCADALRPFVDFLFPAGRAGEQPRLGDVFLTSAHASGAPLAAGRLELAVGHERVSLQPHPRAQGTDREDTQTLNFFLHGALSRIVEMAQAALRPRLRWQLIAFGLCGAMCLISSVYFAYGYAAEHRRILQELDLAGKVYGAAQKLGEVDSSSTLDHGRMHAELDLELTLLDLLCPGYPAKSCSPSVGIADDALSQALLSFRKGASLFLRKRIADRFISPLIKSKRDERNPFYAALRDAAAWRQGEEGASGEKLARGFKALKAVAIIQKTGENCPSTLELQDVRWVVSYFGDLWQLRDRLDTELREKLQRSLQFFFAEYALDYSRETQTRFGFEFNQELVNLAKENLRRLGEAPSDAKYYLIASERQLYGKTLQMRSRFEILTDNPPGGSEAGIRQVFTREGCARFFAADRHSERWYTCVLRESAQQRPYYVDTDIINLYGRSYRSDWMQWLASLSLAVDLRAGDGAAISKALADAPREIDRLLGIVGIGAGGKESSISASADKQPPELLRVCQEAAAQTAPFRLSVTPDAETDPEGKEDAQALAALYQRYRASLGAAAQQMVPLFRTPAPQDEASAVRSALTALSDAARARADWLGRLTRDLGRRSPDVPKITAEPLDALLHKLEGAAWDLLVGPDGQYGKALDKEWRKVFADWEALDKSGDDAATCDAVRGFLNGRVAPFVTSQFGGAFFSRETCMSPPIGDPAQAKEVVCTRSCRAIVDAASLAAAGPKLCCKTQAPTQPPAPLPPPPERDWPIVDSTSAACGLSPYEEVDIDAGSLRPPQRYRCSISTGKCKLLAQPPSADQNSIAVGKAGQRGELTTVAGPAGRFYDLVRGRDYPAMRREGRVATLYALPSEGKCSDVHLRIYMAPAMKEPPPPPPGRERCPWQRPGFLPNVLVSICSQ